MSEQLDKWSREHMREYLQGLNSFSSDDLTELLASWIDTLPLEHQDTGWHIAHVAASMMEVNIKKKLVKK